ncbi:SPW repeat protein [Streptomyces sp. NA02950]|nr:SPW repeat protein [Streptomyces sp. NA02950]
METHPDIVALRTRSEQATVTPTGQGIEALSLLTGLYIAASPWIVGFNGLGTLAVNNLITGIAFALLAIGFGSAFERTHGMSWAAAALGVWTIIAPWVVSGPVATAATIASNVVAGALAVACAGTTAATGAAALRR